jgi:aspartyl-tRNA synthetase
MYKTHTCGEIRASHAGQTVTLAGWVHRRRDHGGVVFIDLRDRYGLTQVVFNPDLSKETLDLVADLRAEWVVQITGLVHPRPEGMANPNLPTGGIEVIAKQVQVLNPSKPTPIIVSRDKDENEDLRLKYRYLDLRRERMTRNMILRHRVVKYIRDYMDQNGFLEIETPILSRAVTHPSRTFLCPAPVTATIEAVADGGGDGPLLPDRALFPRRRPARRPSA